MAALKAKAEGRGNYWAGLQGRLKKSIARLGNIIRGLEPSAGGGCAPGQAAEVSGMPGGGEDCFCVFARDVACQLERIGKARLAETYRAAVNSFLRFRGEKGDVTISEIDSDMLLEYEAWLRKRGLVPNTTSFYMRNLRALYNRAVRQGLAADGSPFREVYTGVEKTVKRAVSSKVISRIKNLDLSADAPLEQSRDLFMFSFYTRGMSFVDMAKLRKRDLRNGVLAYRRQKTDQQLFVKWEKPMQDIVDKYPNPSSPYLLPIITLPGIDERRQYLNAIHQMNAHLKEIGQRVQSPVPLTSYVARHEWASIARDRQVPLSVISAAMGHESESTTRIYLSSLDTSAVDKANSVVIRSVL